MRPLRVMCRSWVPGYPRRGVGVRHGKGYGGALTLALLVTLPAGACSSGDEPVEAAPGHEPGGRLTVLAAASLTESFTALEATLEQRYPGLDVSVSFGPSSGLVEQALAGAPADVLATANTATMENAVAADAVEEPVIFARNALTLAVPAGNPGGVTSLSDLARGELRVALCEPQVPCGAAADELLGIAEIDAAPDTLDNDVKDVAGKVALGEVDAALVYRTDAAADAERIETVDVPEAEQVVNDYPVAVLRDASNTTAAEAFITALTGEPGREALAEAGFVLR